MKLPKFELIGSWGYIIRLPSVWLAAIASAVVTYILAFPTFLFALIAFFPPEQQLAAALLCGAFVLALVVATRVIRKAKLEEPEDDASEPKP